jgi:hypothetical protein
VGVADNPRVTTRVASSSGPVLIPLLPGARPRAALAEHPTPPPAPALAPLASFDAPSLVARGRRTAAPAGSTAAAPIAAKAALALDPKYGVTQAKTLEAFDQLARRDDVPGAPQVRAVKFLMTGVDGPSPKLYLINTKNVDYHYEFATEGLGMSTSLADFNAKTYFTDARKNLAGTLGYMEKIQAHFKKAYGRTQDPTFAMDIEFKLRDDGTLQVKQARPTVD